MSQAAVEQHGADFGRNPSGTGPFKFAEWRSNEAVVVEKNPDYWDGAASLEAVVYRPITDANTRTAEMLAGGIDLVHFSQGGPSTRSKLYARVCQYLRTDEQKAQCLNQDPTLRGEQKPGDAYMEPPAMDLNSLGG